MAIIKLGPVVSDIRGSIGGTTFARNSAGAYSRSRTKPTYPGSDAQNARTSQMSTVVATWQGTLTTAQREVWESRANKNSLPNKLGDQMTPSGFNLYARANLGLLNTGQTMVVAPTTPLTIDTPRFAIGWTDGTGIEITSVYGWNPAYTDVVQIQRAAQIRLSVNFFKGPWDLLFPLAGATVRAVPALISTDAYLASDTRAFFRFKVVTDDGQVSSSWVQSADVGTIT